MNSSQEGEVDARSITHENYPFVWEKMVASSEGVLNRLVVEKAPEGAVLTVLHP